MVKPKIVFWTLSDSKLPESLDTEEGIGTYKLSAIARKHGYDVESFQGNQFGCDPSKIDQRTKESLQADGIVGVSSFSTAKGLLEKLAQTDSFSQFPLVLGGAGATTTPQQYLEIFRANNPRALVQGDGELLFGRILKTDASRWHEIEGLWTYSPEGTIKNGTFQTLADIDQSPFTDLSPSHMRKTSEAKINNSSLSIEERIDALRSLQFSHFETRRGCYYHCEFCSEPQLAERGVRRMTPKRAVEEMTHLYDQFGITFFNFTDNIAFDKQEWWHEFAHELKESGVSPYLTFGGYGTPKFFSERDWFAETIPALSQVGLSFITLGVQAGSKRVLKDIIRRPDDDPENALRVVEQAVPLGVNVKTDFIVGHPTETRGELQETQEAVRRIYDAGGQVFVRKLGVVPNSGYEIHLGEGKYELPQWTPEFESAANQVLGYHGRKDSFKRVSTSHGVVPNLEYIDRERGIRFPKASMGLEDLRAGQKALRSDGMSNHVRKRYALLYDLVIQQKAK